MSNVEF